MCTLQGHIAGNSEYFVFVVLPASSAFIDPKILLGSNESVWHGVKRYKKLWLKPTTTQIDLLIDRELLQVFGTGAETYGGS